MKSKIWGIAVAALTLGLATGCGRLEPIVSCEAEGSSRPVCGFQNPEDLALLPGNSQIIVSEFGSLDGGEPGRLSLYDLESDVRTVLYEGGGGDPVSGWGAEDCPGPPSPAFSPHGIHLGARKDRSLQLLAVNHGGREAIEYFEVGRDDDSVHLTWRGCVVAPEGSFLNDVAGMWRGGFVATHMFDRDTGTISLALSALLGRPTGYVLQWTPSDGWVQLPGTEGGFPNGIALSATASEIYVDYYLDGVVRRISRETGEELARVSVEHPDNINWGSGGRLLVASQHASLLQLSGCQNLERGACPIPFSIISLDPSLELKPSPVYTSDGSPMGAGSSAVSVEDGLVIGSFAGDRLLRFTRSSRHFVPRPAS